MGGVVYFGNLFLYILIKISKEHYLVGLGEEEGPY